MLQNKWGGPIGRPIYFASLLRHGKCATYVSMTQADAAPDTTQSPDAERPQHNAWWLSTRRHRPEWQSLMAAGVATFTGRPRAHYEAARPGDLVVFYLARPDHAIRAVGVVTKGSGVTGHGSDSLAEQASDHSIEVQYAFEVPNGLPWRVMQAEASLAGAEPVRQRSSGTLFALTESEYDALRGLIVERNPELAASFAAIESGNSPDESADMVEPAHAVREAVSDYAPASIEAALPGSVSGLPPVGSLLELEQLTLLPTDVLEETRDLLEDTGQIVLSGPPGTGKTWLARGLASLVAGDPGRVRVVQFHPATAYEDFIEGLKPQVDAWGRVTYAVIPGIFVRFCETARLDPDHYYVLVVDEINRAPLARVFGELLYALEYRGSQGAVELSVSAGSGRPTQPFYVPENLLVMGTMNSADRSLALVDYALRRRFRFVELEPNSTVLDRWLRDRGNSAARRRVVLDLFGEVNKRLSETLDPDHRLGHTYFMLDSLTAPRLNRLWRTSIKPLLSEYFIPPAGELEEYQALFAEAGQELRTMDDRR